MQNIDFTTFTELEPDVETILMMEESMDFCSEDEDALSEEDDDEAFAEEKPAKQSNDSYIDDSLRMYLNEIGGIALLSAEEEKRLGKLVAEGGPEAHEARNKLVSSNLRLVIHYAKKYLGRGVDLEDLISMGNEGLIKAAEKYNYTLGFRFSTYATWWIIQAITRGIADEGDAIRIPVHMSETITKVNKAKRMLMQDSSEEPTIAEIAKASGLTEKAVMDAIQSMYDIVSFETKIGEDEDSTLENFLSDENAVNPCDAAVQANLCNAINDVLGSLAPKEAMVLRLRNGIGTSHPMTLEEIAKLPGLHVTRERVRQIESKALLKIRRSLRLMNKLRDYVA